ncbi:MAG: type II toxin-antitoxin system Phd/YefM family antitoxin [Coriobacteriales bacterium]|jgi:prevent-host-death family protein|nr:type II toxin-antitoxin system Phd/YefM family antitoxin [Coriobacteriales bacterium]
MTAYPIAEAKSRFSEVIQTVERGEVIFITRGSKKEEVAAIVPVSEWRKIKERRLGTLEGKMSVTFADDWSMTDEELLGYESEISR